MKENFSERGSHPVGDATALPPYLLKTELGRPAR
jgi:hypothetical protein